jgi:hypothetical protein
MAYNMKRGNSAVPFSELGSSPAKDRPYQANGIPADTAAKKNQMHVDAEHPHKLTPAKQKEVPTSKYEKSKGTMSDNNEGSSEEINSLETRLYNLREDLKGGSTGKPPIMAIGKTITQIEARLKKLRSK